MYKLKFFKFGKGLCGADFENDRNVEFINLNQVSSISEIKEFYLPLSGSYKGDYAVVRMQNKDKFYIDKSEHDKLMEFINNKK